LHVANLGDQRIVLGDGRKQRERFVAAVGRIEQEGEQRGRTSVLRIGIACNLDEPDRRLGARLPCHLAGERGEHRAQRLGARVDQLAALLAGENALPGSGGIAADPVDHRKCALLVTGGEEAVGERKPYSRLASSSDSDRSPRKRFRIGGSAEFQEDEGLLFVAERAEKAVRGNLADARNCVGLIAALGRIPSFEQWREEGEVAIGSTGRKPRQRPVETILLHLLRDQQQASVGRQLCRRDLPGD
jgi:hypothetical protein